MSFDTAQNIANDAAIEIGLGAIPDLYGSADPNIVQLRALLKSCGQELTHKKNWTHLRKEWEFTTIQGQSQYAMPVDFHNMLDQTGWNRTNRLPMGGPLSPQEWQFLKSRLVGVTWTVLFRPMNQQITLFPDVNTPGGYDIVFEYISKYWVVPNGQTAATAEEPTANSDVLWFDRLLLLRMLKMKFLRAKGLDQTAAELEFKETFDQVAGDDSIAPILGITHKPLKEQILDARNVPITGFGGAH